MKNAIALGTFDGVHRGHRAVLDLPEGYRKIAVTFEKPPKSVLTGESSLIMTVEDKCRVLKSLGIDEILLLDFAKVRNMTAEEFLSLLEKNYSPALISCGFNYRFGKNGEGNIEILREYCNKKGIEFRCINPVRQEENVISSTIIREMLAQGRVESAAQLLCEAFSFEAQVIEGDKRGRTLGFPTVNQKYPKELVKLKFGVYKTKVSFDGREYEGITNIGIRPTFETDYVISETYIKNFSGDLYRKKLRITPLAFLREEKRFSSVEELKKQIAVDLNS